MRAKENGRLMETFDMLDCSGQRTGERISRDEAHRTGAWHGAFHALLVYGQEGGGRVLFQKRSSEKLIAPARFDVSAGGHYSAGEGPREAGPRELQEELGLLVRFEELVPLGKRVFVHCFTPGMRECEFQDVFLLPAAVEPASLVLQPAEVDAVLELEIGSALALFSGREPVVQGELFRRDGSRETAIVRADEFVPCIDNYYLKLVQIAKRYFEGEREGLVI